MNIQFSLIKQSEDPRGESIIYLWAFDRRFKDRKFKFSTRQRISEKLWDQDNETIRVRPSLQPIEKHRLNAINQHLKALRNTVEEFDALKLNSSSLSGDELRRFIESKKKDDRKADEERVRQENDFFATWQKIIDTTKGKSGERVTAGTKRSKIQTMNLLSAYCLAKGLKPSFEKLDMDFYHSLDQYMLDIGLNPNSRGKHFKELKAVMREAHDRDIPVNPAFMKKSFKVIRKDTDAIYLNDADIKKLLDAKGLTPGQEKLRDIFVMACFVGARHSDWHQIQADNIVKENGREILRIRQRKTNDVTHVPVHPVVRMILNKYHGVPPKVISNQKFNAALNGQDGICRKAKLKNADHVSTHTARRSFATNAYLSRSMDVYAIMRCTGHKSESSFLKYLKLNGKDFAIQASDAKFFNDSSLVPKMQVAS